MRQRLHGLAQTPVVGPYAAQLVLDSGAADAWGALFPGAPGPTCCQDPDLLNPVSALDQRIDLILVTGGLVPSAADVLGEDPADVAASGHWPSDHAGVVATLDIVKTK